LTPSKTGGNCPTEVNLFETFRVALRALVRNKLRSFLTILGIIIGVGAVIAMVAIGEGAKARVQESFASMGSNLLIVLPGSTSAGGARGGFGSMPTLTWDDLFAIRNEVPSVRYAAAQLRVSTQIQSEDQNWNTSTNGTSPEYFLIRAWAASAGRLLLDSDVESSAKVVVLGQTVVDKLFGSSADPMGQIVRIKNIPFEVVGVLAKKGQSPTGQNYDDGVFIPQTTFQSKIQGGLQKYLSGSILIGAASADNTARAEMQVTALLRDRHLAASGADDDFSIRNLTEIANAQEEGTKTLTTLLGSIAAVSLLVGGIGIMNIMLVSVTERTRQIGVRMAVGATPMNILLQFLVEALTLAIAGGIVGVAGGVFVAGRLAAQFSWPVLIQPNIILISVGFSALVGIVFGLYPARKASQLDPIDALRYE
jgi:putative ABC transport system permease protein